MGIIFVDEIDKIAGDERLGTGPTSRGRACSATCCRSSRARRCNTATATCKTDHILFIAAGAFHRAKPTDLMPELQGRFPDPRRAERPDPRRFRAHPPRAAGLADRAVRGPAGDRRRRRWSSRSDAIDALADFAFQVNRSDAEHRRPAAVHDHGAAARGAQLRGPRPHRQNGRRRRGARPPAARRAHAGRGPEPVHPLTPIPFPLCIAYPGL